LSTSISAARRRGGKASKSAASLESSCANPTNPSNAEAVSRETQAAAHMLAVQLHVLHASAEREFDTVFVQVAQLRADALVISPDPFFFSRCKQLGALTLGHASLAIAPYREFAAAGGLMSCGTNITELFRQLGGYTGRILNGEMPTNLPVQQVTKVDLVINLKTAKALGVTVPITLLGRADEVIE
jgi:putative tryptophan/tyrosine transport system substrate-binding protein